MEPSRRAEPADPHVSLLPAVRALCARVRNPAQYLGGEYNLVRKDPVAVSGRVALCYPDTYEVGSSHTGLRILYQILNEREDLAAERVFTPWPDMADAMREAGVPLFTLESHLPVRGFDLLAITLQTELTYANVVETLDLAGVPPRAAERTIDDPVVVAGGHGAMSPETLAGIVDVFVPGDGEEAIAPFSAFVAERKRVLAREAPRPATLTPAPPPADPDAPFTRTIDVADGRRERLLHEIATRFDFAYVPAMYEARFEGRNGSFRGLTPRRPDVPAVVKGASVGDFDEVPYATRPIVPHARSVHDRISLEIMRGCTRGCRFCQAGMITRPMRYRRPETLVRLAEETWRNTGFDEISLTSLSSGDYPWIEELIRLMAERFTPRHVSVSLPSLRVTGELARLPGMTNGVRKAGLTFAPEVATDRLRRIINKDIRNEDVLRSAEAAYREGWTTIKLYYMIGIPGEMDEDLRAVVEFADELSRLRQKVTGKGRARVNVTVTTFVPKAFVPFQWDGMMDQRTVEAKQAWMRSLNRSKAVRLKFHDAASSYLEGILSRGDRRLTEGLIEAHRRGARFCAWREHFSLEPWLDAFDATGVDPRAFALRERARDEALPWDHLDIGPNRDFLWAERERARDLIKTDYCVGKICHRCGVPPKLCFVEKKDKGLLGTRQQGILTIDEDGVTRGVAGAPGGRRAQDAEV